MVTLSRIFKSPTLPIKKVNTEKGRVFWRKQLEVRFQSLDCIGRELQWTKKSYGLKLFWEIKIEVIYMELVLGPSSSFYHHYPKMHSLAIRKTRRGFELLHLQCFKNRRTLATCTWCVPYTLLWVRNFACLMHAFFQWWKFQ